MQHDDDVGAGGQCLAIAGLLVAAVAIVAVVLEDEETKTAGEFDGVVGAAIIHKNADVDQVGHFSDRGLESFLRIVGGHDDRDALAVNHFAVTKGVTDSLPEMVRGKLVVPTYWVRWAHCGLFLGCSSICIPSFFGLKNAACSTGHPGNRACR